MGVGVRVLKGVNSHITDIFLNVGLVWIGEAGTIEDENQEQMNAYKRVRMSYRILLIISLVLIRITTFWNHYNIM
jgi:hypothetical protein